MKIIKSKIKAPNNFELNNNIIRFFYKETRISDKFLFKKKGHLMDKIIKLLEPQKDIEFPLMKALEKRRTIRKWKDAHLTEQEISNLLWAACGITKNKYGKIKSKRTEYKNYEKYLLNYLKGKTHGY